MRVWSSANFFTSRTNDVLSYCTQDVKNKRDECGIIDTYFRNYFRCRGEQLDTAPLHDLDRHFIKLFEKFYPNYTPGFVIQHDFAQKELHLNLFGDFIRSPHSVSVFSSRYFGGFQTEDMMFYIISDMSKEMRCPVLNYTFTLDENKATCKVYLAQGKQKSAIFRSSNPNEELEKNSELLLYVFSNKGFGEILTLSDPFDFSHKLCSSLDIIEGGIKYSTRLDKECRFICTEKLYDIYDRKI